MDKNKPRSELTKPKFDGLTHFKLMETLILNLPCLKFLGKVMKKKNPELA